MEKDGWSTHKVSLNTGTTFSVAVLCTLRNAIFGNGHPDPGSEFADCLEVVHEVTNKNVTSVFIYFRGSCTAFTVSKC